MLETRWTGAFFSRLPILESRASQAARIGVTSSRSSLPLSVILMLFDSLSNRTVPALSSKSLTAWETADCVI